MPNNHLPFSWVVHLSSVHCIVLVNRVPFGVRASPQFCGSILTPSIRCRLLARCALIGDGPSAILMTLLVEVRSLPQSVSRVVVRTELVRVNRSRSSFSYRSCPVTDGRGRKGVVGALRFTTSVAGSESSCQPTRSMVDVGRATYIIFVVASPSTVGNRGDVTCFSSWTHRIYLSLSEAKFLVCVILPDSNQFCYRFT